MAQEVEVTQQTAEEIEEAERKEKAKEVLKELYRLCKKGKLPQALYDLIVKYAGKSNKSEKDALKYFTEVSTNMVKDHKNVQNAPKADVQKVLLAFAKRRDEHNMFGKSWARYLNDLMCLWMFDYQKIWEKCSNGELD